MRRVINDSGSLSWGFLSCIGIHDLCRNFWVLSHDPLGTGEFEKVTPSWPLLSATHCPWSLGQESRVFCWFPRRCGRLACQLAPRSKSRTLHGPRRGRDVASRVCRRRSLGLLRGRERRARTTWEPIAVVRAGADGAAVGGTCVPHVHVEALTLPM